MYRMYASDPRARINLGIRRRLAPLVGGSRRKTERITMLLVTHDVEEAVFLGDRVVVMQPSPGRIRRTVAVDLPHPRNRSDPAFIRLRDDVLSDFVDAGVDERRAPPRDDEPGEARPSRLQLAW